MRGFAIAVAVAGLVLTTSACRVNVGPEGFGLPPECSLPSGDPDRLLILMAQSVPTSSQLPCIRGQLPLGWTFGDFDVRNGAAQFWLDSDRDGQQAVTVLLSASCETGGATPVASEYPGMRQYERVTRVTAGYGGERYYLYPGGCTTYRFNLHGESRAQPVVVISQVLSFISRDTLRQQVRELTDGRMELDPSPQPISAP
jgi:hypothetical protein